ncbi:crotonase/enoyl-CoA hydratase family protein [Azospirillum sp. sgz301742]
MNEHTFAHLTVERKGALTLVGLNRPDKRNAISDALLGELDAVFSRPPEGTRCIVLHGHGEHFSAGLDLSEHRSRTAYEVMQHSQAWHRVFHQIQFGGVPVVAAMRGAVIGGGLELAAAAHVRVAEPSCFYALPEGQRGIYVGGGASVRVARIIGVGRMTEMMLTGRSYDAEDGLRLGLSHHLTPEGEAMATATHLAERIASNAPMSNYAILNALPRISDMSMNDGFFTESLMAALVQTSSDAEERMHAFLEKRGPKAGA